MKIKKSHSYTACIETKAGNIVINLMPKAATQAVNAFVILANHHFYDGSRFNLIAKGAYIGASASKQAKFSVPLKNAGTYFMPTTVFLNRTRSGRAELGSMFICSGAHCESLDATGSKRGSGYSVIGFVSKGQRVVTDIAQGSTTAGTSAGPLTQARAAKPTVVTTVRIYASYSPPSFPGDNSGS